MKTLDELLARTIHEGALDPVPWRSFVDLMRSRTKAASVSLVLRSPQTHQIVECVSGRDLRGTLDFLYTPTAKATRVAYDRMREDRVYALDELIEPNDAARARYRREVLDPPTLTNLRLVRFSGPAGIEVLLTVAGDDNVGSAASALMTKVVPHLRAAIRVFLSIQRERQRTQLSDAIVSRLGLSWIAVDVANRIIAMSTGAEALFREGKTIRLGRENNVFIPDRVADAALTGTVRACAADPEHAAQAIRLEAAPLLELLVMPPEGGSAFTSTPVAALIIVREMAAERGYAPVLGQLFGFSPSEARLAQALVDGRSLREAARDLNITEETARTYSKQIFVKAGVRSQTDLVRTILRGVAPIARSLPPPA